MAADLSRRYSFDAFELDARTGELRRRGVRIRLSGRPIALLLELLARPGELVTRDELRAALWPSDTFVDFDHGVNSAMNRLREALRDPADRSRLIETLPRRGYRFIGPVEIVEDASSPGAVAAGDEGALPSRASSATDEPLASATAETPPAMSTSPVAVPAARRWRRWPAWVAAAAACLVLVVSLAVLWRSRQLQAGSPARVMLVVLPFGDLTAGSSDGYLADGITDELISEIGALDPARLGVIARTTSMQYRGSDKSVMTIAEELGVQYLLEGTVRRDGARVRVTARLVDVDSQTQRWTESYERSLDDLLALQRDIAMRAATALAGGVLSPVLRHAAAGGSPPFAVYQLILRARALRQQATEQSAWQCVATFEEAIRLEPGYAPAHAGLADCYRLLGAPGWEAGPPAELMDRARAAIAEAIRLDSRQPEAYAVRGMVTFATAWDTTAAERDLRQAIGLNPSYARAHQYLSSVLTTQRRFDEAVAAARKAVDLDPLSPNENTTLGVRLFYAGKLDEAIAQFRRTLQRSPDLPVAHWGLGMAYRELGRHGEAVAALERAVALSGNAPYMQAWLAHQHAVAGHPDRARAIRRDLERQATHGFVSPFLFALMASGLGERDETLMWLERTAAARSGWVPFLPVEPEFRWLHDNPRFRAIGRSR
jgi:TolB-like protein/DNA-binding winged helix-turn-helix (wHTH) protein/Tfp pilus assembly protein PilF